MFGVLPVESTQREPGRNMMRPRIFRSQWNDRATRRKTHSHTVRILARACIHVAGQPDAAELGKYFGADIDALTGKERRPSLAGGGIGATTLLGDVIVSSRVRWDATTRFAHQPWAHAAYTSNGTQPAPTYLATAQRTLIPVGGL